MFVSVTCPDHRPTFTENLMKSTELYCLHRTELLVIFPEAIVLKHLKISIQFNLPFECDFLYSKVSLLTFYSRLIKFR